MSVPTETMLLNAAPPENRTALKARLQLLDSERSKTAFAESNRIHGEHRARGVGQGGQMMSAMSIRMAEVAYEIGLKAIDACLDTGVRDSAAIIAHVMWSYERFVEVHIPSRLKAPSMDRPPERLITLCVQGAKQRMHDLRPEVEARKHAVLRAEADKRPMTQTFNVTTGPGSQVQAGHHVSGNQSMTTYEQVLDRMRAAIETAPMPEADKRAALQRLADFVGSPGVASIAKLAAAIVEAE